MEKIELHLHLEGAAPPDFIRGIAKEKRLDLSGVFDERGAYAYDDFPGFLRCYEAATGVLQTPCDYARLLAEVLERCAEEGHPAYLDGAPVDLAELAAVLAETRDD